MYFLLLTITVSFFHNFVLKQNRLPDMKIFDKKKHLDFFFLFCVVFNLHMIRMKLWPNNPYHKNVKTQKNEIVRSWRKEMPYFDGTLRISLLFTDPPIRTRDFCYVKKVEKIRKNEK